MPSLAPLLLTLFGLASGPRPESLAHTPGRPVDRAEPAPIVFLRAPLPARVRVPGGTFTMGSSPFDVAKAMALCRRELWGARCDDIGGHFRAEAFAHRVTVSAFTIDRTEVTVAAYERCVATGSCTAPGFRPGDPRFGGPDLPVTQVRWEDAATYCAWAGGRLPTEAEWELAARGALSRDYPWGEQYNGHLCNHGAFAADDTDGSDGFVGLAPVGSFPDGMTQLGVVDLAGNAAEWVADFFDLSDDGIGYPPASEHNPRGPKTGSAHVVRGGSYLDGAAWMRAAQRGTVLLPRSSAVGFRCAKDAT